MRRLVGSGTGPPILAPVAVAAATILSHAASQQGLALVAFPG